MAFLGRSMVNKTELATSLLSSVDIGSIVATSLTLADDITRSLDVANRIQAYVTDNLGKFNSKAIEYAGYDGLRLINFAKQYLPAFLNFVDNSTRNQVIQSAGGYRITSAMLGQEIKIYNALNQIDLMTSVLIDIPEAYAKDKVVKYLNKLLAPNLPNEKDFYMEVVDGTRQYSQLVDYYMTDLGYNEKDAKAIANFRAWSIGKASLHDAWLMARKGLRPDSYFFNIAKFGLGWTLDDAKALYEHFYYTLSPMEIFRISDLMPVSPTWLNKKINALGFSDEDKALIATLIQSRTTKDEINQAWNILLDNYSWGLQTETDLTSFLTENHVPDIQVKAKLIVANLAKEKVILKLMRDAEIYLYRKNVLNENQLLTNLQDLTIGLDVANAITRNEAAKKGTDWEIPP
jgi:hypothetical protein